MICCHGVPDSSHFLFLFIRLIPTKKIIKVIHISLFLGSS
uniref:Uncharacterized protein n=1 Tax=Arundo donax TaxID=35708 RepID=A0A0A8YDG3_ARUDO